MTILTKYIGLDVHRDTISIAVANDGSDREVRFFGIVANDGEVLHKALASIGKDGAMLKVCYESGPCGVRDLPRPEAPWDRLCRDLAVLDAASAERAC